MICFFKFFLAVSSKLYGEGIFSKGDTDCIEEEMVCTLDFGRIGV